MALDATCLAAESTCYGTVSNGRLENAVAFPTAGANFSAYSSLASTLGERTSIPKCRAM